MQLPTGAARALPKTGVALGAAVLALGAGAATAQAAGSTLVGQGLHIATGALVDPNGRTWVSDHNAGFCRVSQAGDDGPGQIEHPQQPGGPEPRTCLGGLLPDAAPGPDAAGDPAFLDPSPEFPGSGDELAFIPDGASPSSEVVRAKWNQHTGRFEFLDTVTMQGDRGRPVSASLGPDENVYVSFQRETTLQRITDPAGDTPIAEIVGRTSDARGAAGVAAGLDAEGRLAVYVAESEAGLRVLRPNPIGRPITDALAGVELPAASIGALGYDGDRNVLYAGTADATESLQAGTDELMRIDIATGTVHAEHATGYTAVGGVTVKPDGNVLVQDDPALIDPVEPLGMGRLFHVGLPAAHVVRGPIDDAGELASDGVHTKDTTPAFEVEGDGTVECRLSGSGLSPSWDACPEDGVFAVSETLTDGRYVLSVRSREDGVTGLPEARSFVVDTTAPLLPSVVRPADGTTVGISPWFEFKGETNASFTCIFDDAPAEPCAPGRIAEYAGEGTHTLRVAAVDAAGNASEHSVAVTYTVDPTLAPTPAPGWGEGPPSHRGSTLFTHGLHISTGSLVDPNGRVWVADHNAGFCRVGEPGEDGAGAIEHPQLPSDFGIRTCLGGLLPGAGTGPDAAGQPTLVDPTPDQPGNGDEMVLIPDGASPSSEVVRVLWNPDSGLFEYHDTVSMIGDRTRPVAASLGADGAVYVVFQRSGDIQRIARPAGSEPIAQVVGFTANGRRSAAVAAGRDAEGRLTVYVAEDAGLTAVRPSAAAPQVARPSFVLPIAAPAINAMISDGERGHLYVGTANGLTQADEGIDSVHRIDTTTGAVEEFSTGYSMIGGFGLRPDGVLFVSDDPALLDPAEPMGTGRLFHVGLPAAHITRGPLLPDGTQAANRAFVSSDLPTFEIEGEGTVQCKLTGGELAGEWVDCPADGTFVPAAPLADGSYQLAVRSVDGDVTGLVEVHRFTVDTTAPAKPSIVAPTARVLGATPWFEFDAEAGARFECEWNDSTQGFEPCEPGRTRTFTENASHTLVIRAIDRAGNVSEESDELSFEARGVITRVTIDSGPEGRTRDNSPTFTYSADAEDVTFGCRLSGQAFAACSGPKSYANLADGTYTFEVRAMDSTGNIAPVVKRTFTVDRVGPLVNIGGVAEGATTGADVTFSLAISEEADLVCRIDAEAFRPCAGTTTFTGLADGEHLFEVVGTDTLGNVGQSFTRRFTVESGFVAPPAPPAPAPQPTVTVIDAETGLPFQVRIVDIDRRVDLDRIQQAGIAVTIRPATGTQQIRFRIFRVDRGRRGRAAAAAKPKPVATIYRRTRGGQLTVKLTRRELRKVRAGSYQLEVTTKAQGKRSKPVYRKFRVIR